MEADSDAERGPDVGLAVDVELVEVRVGLGHALYVVEVPGVELMTALAYKTLQILLSMTFISKS